MPITNKVLKVEQGKAEVIEAPMPTPKEGFVVVKQAYAPNCIEHRVYKTGFYEWHESPVHLGHEGVGTISEIGPGVSGLRVGDRVIIFQGYTCGECWVCSESLGATHCIDLKGPKEIEEFNESVSGGNGFCEYRLAQATMVSKIPDSLDFKYAAAGNCLIGCTYSSMRDHNISTEDIVLIGGVGFVGHATLVNLKYRGAKVIALGRDEIRMKTAAELGVDHIVNPDDEDWLEQVKALTPQNRGVDYAFECSGYEYYQQKCLDALRHYGTLILLGYAAHEGPDLKWALNTEFGLSWGHKTITSHFDVNFNHRQSLIELLQDPWIQKKVDRLVSHVVPMSKAASAFEALNAKTADKVFFKSSE